MVNQQIYLPMIPDSAPIVVNISQYDFDAAGYAGRLFFNLVYQGTAYDTDGASAIFQGEKPDGTTFAYPASVVNQSVVRVNVRQQMTTVSGRVICQLILSNTDGQIGSFNIWLEVQPSSASGGDPSQTDIPALIAQAKQYADIAEQAAIDVAAYSANPPYIGANGNWFVWDATNNVYTDTGVYAAGSEGNMWYTGTAVAGKDPTPTVYPTGIASAHVGDMYLNKSEGAIYQCTLGGVDSVAKWAYVMTLTGGGGGGVDDYDDLDHRPQINGVTLTGNKTSANLGLQGALTEGNGINIDPVTLEISADLLAGSNISITPKNGKLEISSTGGGGGGGLSDAFSKVKVGATTLQSSGADTLNLKAGSNVTLTPNASTNEVEISATGGGGPSYDMINNDGFIATMQTNALDDTDDDVASTYAIANWANLDALLIKTTVNQNDTGVGTWDSDGTWESGTRSGWMWHEALYQSLEDAYGNPVDDIQIDIVNDMSKSEVVSLLSYRIDDEVFIAVTPVGTENPHDEGWYESDGQTPPTYTLTSDTAVQSGKTYYKAGGAVALKFGKAITSTTLEVSVKLTFQRTKVVNATILS